MGTKTGILIGVGIGYVLGTRAGRERYEQIRANASKLRRFPIVARPLDAAGQKMSDIVRAGGEQVTDKVADAVKERLFGAPASQPTTVDAQTTSPRRSVERARERGHERGPADRRPGAHARAA